MTNGSACSGVPQASPPESRLEALQALRLRIDKQDLSILQAIEQRGRIVEEILALKRSAGFPAFDAIRERQLLERLHATYRGPYQWQEVEQLFRTLLEMSRTLPVPARNPCHSSALTSA